MSILITGATGFIGRHVVAELTRQGHQVTAMLRSPQKTQQLRQQVDRLGGDGRMLAVAYGDLDQPQLGMKTPVADLRAVIHLGASFGWRLDPAAARTTNVEGALTVARVACEAGARLVNVTGFMLENHRHLRELGIDLDSTEATRWPAVYKRAGSYEASKLESALRVREYAATNAMQWVEVQPATVSGHSQSGELDAGQPLWALIDNLFHGRLALIPGSQQHWLPLVAVDTVASMIARAALAKQVPPRLLVLDPETPNLAGLLGLLAAELEVRAPIRHIPVSVLRGLLSLPGMERLMNTSRESLDFLQVERFDTADTLAFGRSEGLVLPAVADSVKASARYWKQHQQFRY